MQGKFDVRGSSRSNPAHLYELLLDARSWPRWGTVDELVLARSEHIDPDGHDGVGAVRAFRTGRVVTSERITQLVPDRLFEYQDASNPVMSDYLARVELTPRGTGTEIHWTGRYRVGFPLGLVLRPFLARTMRRMARGLAAE